MFLFGRGKKKKAAKPKPRSKPKARTRTKRPKVKAKAARSKRKTVARVKGARPKKGGPRIAYLGLGSNVGDREEFIEQAVFLLGKTQGIKILKRSTNYETEAEGSGDQPPFLNAAVAIMTTLSPYKLLDVAQGIEAALGRERDVEWGPRTIDVDILMYDDEIVSDDKLQIPHPLLHERIFVLKPLSDIAPDAVHPTLERTISELFEEKKTEAGEKYDDELPGFKEIKESVPDDYERW
jgi:2-amino-4-hydroxy-6-hydroxymethyldihydropteridine diphosphokinase